MSNNLTVMSDYEMNIFKEMLNLVMRRAYFDKNHYEALEIHIYDIHVCFGFNDIKCVIDKAMCLVYEYM